MNYGVFELIIISIGVPRHHIIHDVLTYLQEGRMSKKMLQRMYVRPTQTQQVEYIYELAKR